MEKPNKNVLLRIIEYIRPVSVIMLPGCIAALRAVSADLLYFSDSHKLKILNILSFCIVFFFIMGGGEYYWDKMRTILTMLKKEDPPKK